jgi:hypothetical protein
MLTFASLRVERTVLEKPSRQDFTHDRAGGSESIVPSLAS